MVETMDKMKLKLLKVMLDDEEFKDILGEASS